MLYKNRTAFLQIKFTGLWLSVLFFFTFIKHQVFSVNPLTHNTLLLGYYCNIDFKLRMLF